MSNTGDNKKGDQTSEPSKHTASKEEVIRTLNRIDNPDDLGQGTGYGGPNQEAQLNSGYSGPNQESQNCEPVRNQASQAEENPHGLLQTEQGQAEEGRQRFRPRPTGPRTR